ncbi:hypothetical protein Bca101_013057 [Brassica carinata]
MMSYCREPKYISLLLEDYFDCLHNSKEIMVQATVSGFKKTLDQTDESCLDHWVKAQVHVSQWLRSLLYLILHIPKEERENRGDSSSSAKSDLNRAGVPSLKMESSLDMRSGIRGT